MKKIKLSLIAGAIAGLMVLIINGKLSAQERNGPQMVSSNDVKDLQNILIKRGIRFGTFLNVPDINLASPRRADFLDQVSKYFDFYTMSVTYSVVEGKGKGIFNFTSADKTCDFALAHNAKVKGHVLIMGNALPAWLTNGHFSSDELKEIMHNHITTVIKHFKDKYPGLVTEWNVVNEAACNGGAFPSAANCFPEGIKKNIWTDIHKPGSSDPTDYIQYAFEWAHQADPNAKLLLNENGIEGKANPKKDRVYNLVRSLQKKGVPIDGVGFESHIRSYEEDRYSLPALVAELNRYADLGLQTEISEFDVILASGNQHSDTTAPSVQLAMDHPSNTDFVNQAKIYSMFLTACLTARNCTAFITWGVSDNASWVNLHWKGSFYPHLLDDNMQPKLTFKYLIDAARNYDSRK